MSNTLRRLLGDPRRIGFFGIGRSNLSLMSGLWDGVSVTLRSDKEIPNEAIPKGITPERILCGASALSDINEDCLILSPSVNRKRAEIIEAQSRGVTVTSDCELFFKAADAPVLAVTGSSGKSTTSALTHAIIRGGGRVKGGAVLCGNGGVPMLRSTENGAGLYVCELSSFMLSYLKSSVKRSAITGITPNHLDFHSSFEEYRDTKLGLLALSHEGVISADDEILYRRYKRKCVFGVFSTERPLRELVSEFRAEHYGTLEDGWLCHNGEMLVHTSELVRREPFNLKNMLCAVLLSYGYSHRDAVISALKGFRGLPHRNELAGTINGVRYINSSIDTTPERCLITLSTYPNRPILLLGGRGKGLSYDGLIPALAKSAGAVICFGEEGERLFSLLQPTARCRLADGLASAVKLACECARPGDTVLLSPACTSYDEFGSFEERGEEFKRLVSLLGKDNLK